ncbi:pseudouridine synthase [Taibaiella lutea]|uniref:Pseudouridine synthase n=1 Tax=Taibaiella lutea TaxID=2608001 RepID=A0A5M6CEF4_9BACT|nr:pseudouridine synthase [Taibaiella lutea]KAA5533481.1 pseudouridine synthase [Taibaiella lutea]
MNKKPFHNDNRSDRKPFGSKEEKPFRKSFDNKEEKPFRKSFGNKEDKPPFKKPFNKDGERPFKKPFGANEDRPFKKPFDKDGDRPFKKSYNNTEDRPFKKSFDKDGDRPRKSFDKNEDRPFKKSFDKDGDRPRKSFGNSEDRPFKKPFNKDGDKPFKKSFGNSEDRPFKKSFDKNDDRPRKSFGNDEERPFRKSFDKDGDKPFRKSFGNSEDRPFKKSFDKDGDRPRKSFGNDEERPFRKSFDKDGDRPFKKSFGNGEDRPFKKSFDKDDNKSFKKPFGKDKNEEEKKPNRYANAFGNLDDEELAASKKKQAERRAQKEQQEEVTFSKEVDGKWDEAPVEKVWGRSDIKPKERKSEDEYQAEKRERRKHTDTSRFIKQFDDENEHEKAYTAKGGKKAEKIEGKEIDDQLMPLNKFIAHCDVCSRRDAVTLIKEGKVTVNGELVIEPGHKVTTEDEILLNGQKLKVQKNLIYILMNKPKGFITTTDDPKGRRTVMEMVENVIDERVFPVGRLDRNTTGLLLLTNDGELTQKLSHPKHNIKKVYKATLDKNLSKEDFEKIKKGVILEDGPAPVDQLEYLESKNEIGLEIHSGKNRIVRRIFESLGYVVEKLDRVSYAGLTKKNIMRGKWRLLTKQEVINLKHMH